MSSDKIQSSNESSVKVVLRDLHSLLRKAISESLILRDVGITNLLSKGENFCSTMLKIEAKIKRNEDSNEEQLSLVAKMMPCTDFHKTCFKLTASFKKEIFVFEKLLPTYRQLEKEIGVKDEDLIDLFPKFYGGRLTLQDKHGEEADENVVLLMENIKIKGFRNIIKKKGFSLPYIKMVIVELARFHALSIALRVKPPKEFEEAKKIISVFPFHMPIDENADDVYDIANHLTEALCQDSRIAPFKDRIKKTLKANTNWKVVMKQAPLEPWCSFIHGDFQIMNIMFRHENNVPVELKFFDFQLMDFSSPLKDLAYFLFGSGAPEILEYLDDLLCLYYKRFLEMLTKLKCDTSPYTKKNFEEHLQMNCRMEFFHCITALKYCTFDIDEDTDLSDMTVTIMRGENNSLFLDRAYVVLCKYLEKDWLIN